MHFPKSRIENHRDPCVWGCSSVVERSLCMWKARGSIPRISTIFHFQKMTEIKEENRYSSFVFYFIAVRDLYSKIYSRLTDSNNGDNFFFIESILRFNERFFPSFSFEIQQK